MITLNHNNKIEDGWLSGNKEGDGMDNMCLFSKEWKLASTIGQEKIVMTGVAWALGGIEGIDRRLPDMQTALSEACLNAIEHGNRLQSASPVTVRLMVRERDCVFRVFDEGKGIVESKLISSPEQKRMMDNPRGWGMSLMNALADKVAFGQENGKFFIEIRFNWD